jgi:hypothetical protein
MNSLSLIVDGMLSGTGIRDASAGGYLDPEEIGISTTLTDRLSNWLVRYEDAHFHQFENRDLNAALDEEGLEIARSLAVELSPTNVRYYSNAKLVELTL